MSKIWLLIGSQAEIEQGYYRREMDMATTSAAQPTYTATWHPINEPVETLVRGDAGDVYWACAEALPGELQSVTVLVKHVHDNTEAGKRSYAQRRR